MFEEKKGNKLSKKSTYSLHAGDKMEYRRYPENTLVRAFVTEIGKSNFTTDLEPAIRTSLTLAPLTEHNPSFRIITSERDDAPPIGEWTSIERVNLILGSVKKTACVDRHEQGDCFLREVVKTDCGGDDGKFMAACVLARRKTQRRKIRD